MFRHIILKVRQKRLDFLVTNNNCTILHRGFAKAETESYLGVNYEPDITEDQKKYVLRILNESNPDQLSGFNLSKNRIKKIDAWRKKNGTFDSLTNVLDVDGLGVKMLHRLCKTIIEAENNTEEVTQKPFRVRSQIVSPAINGTKLLDLQSTLGIHLFATGLSWARIERTNNILTHWDFLSYDTISKKLSPTEALQLVLKVSEQLPRSDAYVFEAPISVTPTAQQSSISVTAYAQRVQLLSILMTILSTSAVHNPAYTKLNPDDIHSLTRMEPNVYFLRHSLPARLFRTLIGNERVSAATTVATILGNLMSEKNLQHTPVVVNSELNSMYDTELPVNKEILGQALLLTMTFMDVCIYQNAKSIKAISSKRS